MKKKTKVLLSSALTIAMSASLAIGGTYALFTSEDSVNISVASGTVKVEAAIDETTLALYSFDDEQTGVFENGGTAKFTNDNKDLSLANVTPGDKATFTIKTNNLSNVSVLYRVVMSAEGELAPALTATATINGVKYDVKGLGKSTAWFELAANQVIGDIAVAVEFPENGESDNDYQGKSANVSFAIEAVQGNAPVAKFESLLAKGGTVTLDEDFVISESINIPEGVSVTLDLNGKDIIATNNKSAGAVIVNEGTLVIEGDANSQIKNGTINGASAILNVGNLTLNNVNVEGAPTDTSVGTASYAVNTQGAGSTLTLNNVNISGRGAIGATNGTKVVVNGGTYYVPEVAWGHAIYAVGAGTEVVFNDGTVSEGFAYRNDIWGTYQIYAGSGAKVVVKGGDFSSEWDCANGYDLCTSEGTIEIYGGTFADDPSKQNGKNFVANGYMAVDNGNGTFGIVKASSWDGVVPTAQPESLVVDTTNHLISIDSAEAFAYLNTLVNDSEFYTKYGSVWKYTIELNTNINLNNKAWTPIVLKNFISFEGNGHTVSNLNVSTNENNAGLFSVYTCNDIGVAYIRDLTIDGAYVKGSQNVGVLVGSGNCTAENVTVINATVDAVKYVGVLAGRLSGATNCTVKSSTVQATDKTVGGLVGYAIGDPSNTTFTGNTVDTVTVTGAYNVGGLLGQAQNVTVNGNTVKNATVISTTALPANASSNEVRTAKLAARSAFDTTVIGTNTVENVTLQDK